MKIFKKLINKYLDTFFEEKYSVKPEEILNIKNGNYLKEKFPFKREKIFYYINKVCINVNQNIYFKLDLINLNPYNISFNIKRIMLGINIPYNVSFIENINIGEFEFKETSYYPLTTPLEIKAYEEIKSNLIYNKDTFSFYSENNFKISLMIEIICNDINIKDTIEIITPLILT